MSLALGIDLGGTNIKAALLDTSTGSIHAAKPVPTASERGPAALLETIANRARSLMATTSSVERVGLALPGHFDPDEGTAILLPNLAGDWRGQPIRQPLEAALGIPVCLINDARAHGLAELRMGAGRGTRDLLFIAMGTGVGGAVVIDGHLYLGTAHAGEIGHATVVPDGPLCGCGNRGCLDRVASADAIAQLAGCSSVLEAASAARSGDRRALEAFEQIGRYVGRALADAVVLLWPERIVIGGGVSAAGDVLFRPIEAELLERARVAPIESIPVMAAELGPDAGAIGAALWAMERADRANGFREPTLVSAIGREAPV